MSQLNEARRAALNVEEAALLPALSRSRSGGAALRTALRAAEVMDEMQVSNTVSAQMDREISEREQGTAPVYRQAGSRAALHHILRR